MIDMNMSLVCCPFFTITDTENRNRRTLRAAHSSHGRRESAGNVSEDSLLVTPVKNEKG